MLLIFLEGLVGYPAFRALPPDSALGWASLGLGAVTVVCALWLVFRGIGDLGPNLSARPAPVEGATMVQSGVYARVRHPIYTGVMGFGVGWALVVGSPAALLVALLLAGWLDLKSRREEIWLLSHHPGYAAYRSRTARFVPGVY
jgi:protein-S-isoprenylcysteine O-methyltransferase Ste14